MSGKVGMMINYQEVIQATAKAKEKCYNLATNAYNDNQPDTQKRLYQVIDILQNEIDKLLAMEIVEIKKYPGADWTLLDEQAEPQPGG